MMAVGTCMPPGLKPGAAGKAVIVGRFPGKPWRHGLGHDVGAHSRAIIQDGFDDCPSAFFGAGLSVCTSLHSCVGFMPPRHRNTSSMGIGDRQKYLAIGTKLGVVSE
jgi:hypothetical protein